MILIAKGKFDRWRTKEGLTLLEGWARDGLTDEDIARKMGINIATLYRWKNEFSDICEAVKKGKEIIDFEVERKLLDSALGFKVTVRKPIKVKTEKQKVGEGKIVEEKIVYAEEEIYIPPNATSQIFWLKNRRPDKWRDKPEAPEESDDKLNAYLEGMRNAKPL